MFMFVAMEVLNYVGRADGKRGSWRTGKTEARNEDEMYKILLNDYEYRQKQSRWKKRLLEDG